jgi:zinc transporter ZupT
MNEVVLDGMLRFTGGVMVAVFWSLLAPTIEMTSGVKPAAAKTDKSTNQF